MTKLNPPFQVVCINDKNKPKEIPANKWITFGHEYTVVSLGKTLDNKLGFTLKDIELGEDTFPYDCFSANRFGLFVGAINNETAEEVVDEMLTDLNIEYER